jgi:chromosome segregation ATPase
MISIITLLLKILSAFPRFADALARHQAAAYAELERKHTALKAEVAEKRRAEAAQSERHASALAEARAEVARWQEVIAASARRANELEEVARAKQAEIDRLSDRDAVRLPL